MKRSRHLLALVTAFTILVSHSTLKAAQQELNILWLSAEDISPHLGCYGDPHAITPNLDQLANRGVRYTHAFTTAGVCAPCRSGIITGMYQTTLGTHHMRCQASLPRRIVPFPALLRKAGYYCTNNSKTDYQFKTPSETWDESNSKAHWRNRPDKEQPFFSVFNFTGCHESGIASDTKYHSVTSKLNPAQRQVGGELSTFPPYYPDTPIAREDWKRNYELITALDLWVGKLLSQLEEDGLLDSTLVVFWSDHGIGLPRAKRWLYDSGTRIPLIISAPSGCEIEGLLPKGSTNDRLVSSIDFSATVLNIAGLERPEAMQGQAFLGPESSKPRKYVFGARDRMDERYDIIRMVRDEKFKYLRNYEPLKGYYQYMNTPEKGATMAEMRVLFEKGELGGLPARYFADGKPVEELYDTEADPHELTNLADDPSYQQVLQRMRHAHQEWVVRTKDLGLIPEPILEAEERITGSRYSVLRIRENSNRAEQLAQVADLASGKNSARELFEATGDSDAAVRYWAFTGIGNCAHAMTDSEKSEAHSLGLIGIKDESATVQVAAGRALCLLGKAPSALETLADVLKNGEQWERLHAAIVLDEIDEMARPLIAEMHQALTPREELYARGKYTVRVINHALNQLEKTRRTVP